MVEIQAHFRFDKSFYLGDDYSPYPSNPVSRGRSPAPNTCSVREHVRELSRGRSPSNVDLYSSRESLRVREKSPLARKLEKEGKVKLIDAII